MSEHLPHLSPEHITFPTPEKPADQKEHVAKSTAEAPNDAIQKSLDSLRKDAHDAARNANETQLETDDKNESSSSYKIGSELKKLSYERTLIRIRKRLPTTERLFSKTIHQPVVEALSETGAKVVARPSGLLGGSIVAFFGSLAFLLAARQYGYRYNYTLFLLLFVGGFILGMTLELLLFVLRLRRR